MGARILWVELMFVFVFVFAFAFVFILIVVCFVYYLFNRLYAVKRGCVKAAIAGAHTFIYFLPSLPRTHQLYTIPFYSCVGLSHRVVHVALFCCYLWRQTL